MCKHFRLAKCAAGLWGQSVSQSKSHRLSTSAIGSFNRVCRGVSVATAVYAIVGGTITLLGWVLDVQRMTDWRNDNISMFANTAACVVMGGVALLCLVGPGDGLLRLSIARVLAVAIAMVGSLTLIEHLFNIDLGIDTILVDRPWGLHAATAPMRMGPPGSSSFLVLGAALFLATYGARRGGWPMI